MNLIERDDPRYFTQTSDKPYSPEWHRKRYLKEALDKYFDDYVDVETIREDIYDILHSRASDAYEEYNRLNKLAESL